MLLNLLRVSHPIPDAQFAIDRIATGKVLGWSDKTVWAAIRTLLAAGRLTRVHDGEGIGDPHLYRLQGVSFRV